MLLYRIVIAVRREEQGTLGRPIWLYYRYLASHLGLAGLPVRSSVLTPVPVSLGSYTLTRSENIWPAFR